MMNIEVSCCEGLMEVAVDRYAWVKLLWRKVIIRAVYDYVLWKDIRQIRKRHDAQDAGKWLFEESDLNNSLEEVCLIADVDPEKVRRLARTATKDQVKKLEHIERERCRIKDGDRDGVEPLVALIAKTDPEDDEDDDGDDQ
jgi:hypothetical protein